MIFDFPLLAHSNLEMKMAQFHPIIVHFPIAFFSAALICDLLYFFWGKKGAFYVGHWMIFSATIMTGPAILTGLQAAENYNPNDSYINTHMLLGFATGISGLIYSIIRILAIKEIPLLPPSIYIGFSVVMLALVSWTSDYGGLIVRGITPFSLRPQAEAAPIPETPPEVLKYAPEKLEAYFKQNITVADVIPIFERNHCAKCHSDNFAGGLPINFSTGKEPSQIMLPRNPDGTLKDYAHSPFYDMVILNNKMPMTEDGKSRGLPMSDRLILLQWLQNGAPMEERLKAEG